ncbi:MAG TPA: cytochrome c-type biogenesis protein CcmH [Acidimicrobiales bacterium]
MSATIRRLTWVAIALVASGALLVAALDEPDATTADDRARHLSETIRCPTCRGQSVLESNAATARSIRREINERIADGQTDDEIRAYLVSVHGRSILLTPPRSGLAGLVWVLPVAGLAAALAAVAMTLRRWQTEPPSVASSADETLVAAARSRRVDDHR